MSLEIIEMKVADLVPYAMNAKQHPAEQVAPGIMQVMHNVHGERFVFLRCWVSTVFGEICDKSIYLFVAFAFVLPTSAILGNILTSTILAIVYETILYPLVTRHVISWAKKISA